MATKVTKTTNHSKTTALQYIRTIYLSLAATIGLICFVMGASGAIKLGLNIWLPVDDTYSYYSPYSNPCDQANVRIAEDGKSITTPRTPAEIADCEVKTKVSQEKQVKSQFNREISQSIALAAVGLPIWLLHFWLIQGDWKRRKED